MLVVKLVLYAQNLIGERKMKNKLSLPMLLILLIGSMGWITFVKATNTTLTLSDVELGTQFARTYYNGSANVMITDIPGTGVRFDFTGLASAKCEVSDNYPVSRFAGGAPDSLGEWGDFTAYTEYSLVFTNVGTQAVHIVVSMNTGFLNPASKDTYWECDWTWVGAGETKVITLNFSNAKGYNFWDDPNLPWRYPEGTWHPIHRLDEVSRIGFQVTDFSGSVSTASIVVSNYVPGKVYKTLTLSDKELATQFAYETGPGSVTIADISGLGVRFDFTGLDTSTGTVVGDNFQVSGLAGGAWKDYGSGFSGPYDFSGYTKYSLSFTNVGTKSVVVNLKMNTGWTDPPWGSSQRDTFWQNGWTNIVPGATEVLTLDFSWAEVYSATNDLEFPQYPDGTKGICVWRLDEVSDIGFQVLADPEGSIIVSAYEPDLTLTLKDTELRTQFAYETGPGTVTGIADIPGPGVKFDFSGLSTTVGTVVGDNFPVSRLACGAWKTYGITQQFSTWGDFSVYSRYSVFFTNVGSKTVGVNLKMNTGWTIPPPEYAALWRDTFWQNGWTYVAPGARALITLDFSSAEVYNAGDEQEFPAYSDGTKDVRAWRLDEVSDIGFQVLGDNEGSLVVESVFDVCLSLSDAELGGQFAKEWGPAGVTITDIQGPGVRFDFTGLSSVSGTGVGDNFPVSGLAGGAWKDYGSGFSGPYDFRAYTGYKLAFKNVGTSPVVVNPRMNTGWTDPPWGSSQRDTFWQNGWAYIAAGETRVVTLNFWSAEVWGAEDDPVSQWQYPNGTAGVTVQRLDEVSNIGFQVLGSSDGSIIVTSFFDVFISLSDDELLLSEFAKETGPATVTKTDMPEEPGVRFDFTGLSTSTGTVVGDNFAVNRLAGGSWKTYGITQQFSTWGDFSAFAKYKVVFTNVGETPVHVNLKMNTGWTTQPPECSELWRDTFWQNGWAYIVAGESKVVTLDFSSAEVYNAADEQVFTVYADGTTGVAVWRLDEVSDLGFQVLGDGDASIVVSGFGYPPTASFTYSPSVPKAGETVTLDASSSTPNGGTIMKYTWDFDDGNTTIAFDSTIKHVYASPGTYNVTLTVADSEGLTDSTWQLITVVPAITHVHDVAVTNVTVSSNMVYQGQTVSINVTVANLGNATETFNVTLYYDSNAIATQNVVGLTPSATLMLSFIWNTASVPYCHNYTIKAEASTVPDETNTTNNVFTDGWVKIKIIGDVNGDGKVDIKDLVLLIKAFGSWWFSSRWDANGDFNGDGKVDIKDLVLLIKNFGKTC